jgi:phosphoribosylglycinamide formyltransferase-1
VARLAVLASGNGGNFQAIAEALRNDPCGTQRHRCSLLLYDRKAAFVAERARRLGIPARYLSYAGWSRAEAEVELSSCLDEARIDLVALAGFMRLLSENFVRSRGGKILNVHPSLLPAWPGTDSIRRSWEAGETRFGVSVHLVDAGMDTGPILEQEAFCPPEGTALAEIERQVHEIEHRIYPRVILERLDRIDTMRSTT